MILFNSRDEYGDHKWFGLHLNPGQISSQVQSMSIGGSTEWTSVHILKKKEIHFALLSMKVFYFDLMSYVESSICARRWYFIRYFHFFPFGLFEIDIFLYRSRWKKAIILLWTGFSNKFHKFQKRLSNFQYLKCCLMRCRFSFPSPPPLRCSKFWSPKIDCFRTQHTFWVKGRN